MSVVALEVRKRLPFRPADLQTLVTDVRTYPDFIPWVKSITLKVSENFPSGWLGVASAVVGWKAFNEHFVTRVITKPDEGTVTVSLVSGPFRVLENAWRFEDDGAGGTHLLFKIRYQFKNPILQVVAAANRDLAATRIMDAFIAEATRRFGACQPSSPA